MIPLSLITTIQFEMEKNAHFHGLGIALGFR